MFENLTERLSKSLRDESSHAGPFVLTLLLVFLGYSGLGISLWPNIIPPDISIRAAAGPSQSLGFALVGALLVLDAHPEPDVRQGPKRPRASRR